MKDKSSKKQKTKDVIDSRYEFCSHQHTEDEIREFLDQNYLYLMGNISLFSVILANNRVSEQLIEEMNTLSITQIWTSGRLDWTIVIETQKLSENFIKRYCKFFDKRIWSSLSCFQKLSEKFIEAHEKELNWKNISMFQELSDDFIIKWRHKLDMDAISKYQVLSEDIIWRYRKTLNLDYIIHNHPTISDIFKYKLIEYTKKIS